MTTIVIKDYKAIEDMMNMYMEDNGVRYFTEEEVKNINMHNFYYIEKLPNGKYIGSKENGNRVAYVKKQYLKLMAKPIFYCKITTENDHPFINQKNTVEFKSFINESDYQMYAEEYVVGNAQIVELNK